MNINRDEWLAAIADADTRPPLVDDPSALTAREFAELRGCAWSTAHVKLEALIRAGKVERVSKYVTDVGGRRLRVPAFRLLSGKQVN